MTNHTKYCWVIALKAEASAVIDLYQLKKHDGLSRNGFEVFHNADETHFLIISGVGKVRSASAVTWLAAQLQVTNAHLLWINFGIAGNKAAGLGNVFRAGRIKDRSSERSWYPHPVGKRQRAQTVSTAEILTVDQPCFDYPDSKWLVEMEAAGFVATAARFSSLEWVRCYKVISDNKDSAPETIDKQFVISICEPALAQITAELTTWKALADEFLAQTANIDCSPILEHYHFSVTEQHQLRRLLQRAIILKKLEANTCVSWAKSGSHAQSGKQLLIILRELLTNAETTED